jgi:NAD+ synthase
MKGLELSKEDLTKCENAIMESIVRMVETSNSNGAVVALSGGVDSSLVATLASRVVDVYGLILPYTTSNNIEDAQHAQDLAKQLGIDYEVIEIDPVVDAIYQSRPKLGPKTCDLAYANVKARARMIMNYFAANLDGRVVLGTGNKTECLMGYFTKYGDGGVDALPIGDLYKTRVWQMARHTGVPDVIVNKPPSAGLWKGQTDEAEMGITYKLLDQILYGTFDLGLSLGELKEQVQVDDATFAKVMERIKNSEHKRNMPPIVDISVLIGH